MSPAPNSSRWCPTPEQLMILEEMYRSGTRTPNASQIQQITAHLSFYGKIEGKNVFYWFQNHKARDRQKLRRKLYKQLQQQQQQQQALYHHQHQHQYMMMNTFNATSNFNNYCQNNNNSNTNNNIGLNYSANNSVLTSPHFHHHLPQSSIGTMPQVQGGLFEDKFHHQAPSTQNYNNEYENHHHHQHHLMSYNRKMEANDQSHMMRVYDRDWMMMLEQVGPETTNSPTPSNTNNIHKPLQTLELFPVTSTNLKEDSSTTTTTTTSYKLSPTN